ncbi:hypothetical protein BJ912DRAFT_958859 [Pholiota molesta]|nr:hypothetical protein BJ912DRAFT_958859 [Pholiota molesta]
MHVERGHERAGLSAPNESMRASRRVVMGGHRRSGMVNRKRRNNVRACRANAYTWPRLVSSPLSSASSSLSIPSNVWLPCSIPRVGINGVELSKRGRKASVAAAGLRCCCRPRCPRRLLLPCEAMRGPLYVARPYVVGLDGDTVGLSNRYRRADIGRQRGQRAMMDRRVQLICSGPPSLGRRRCSRQGIEGGTDGTALSVKACVASSVIVRRHLIVFMRRARHRGGSWGPAGSRASVIAHGKEGALPRPPERL